MDINPKLTPTELSEYRAGIEAAQCTWQFSDKLRPSTPQDDLESLALFGGERQGTLFPELLSLDRNNEFLHCGANLLTEADLALVDAMIACVDWVNSIAGPAPDGAVRDVYRVNMDGSGVPVGIEALGKETRRRHDDD